MLSVRYMYKINPDSYSSVFVLPTQIADEHLRMAGKAQLKVLLWLFRNPTKGGDIKRISRDTGIPEDEIDDAMLYWMEAGLILNDDENGANQTSEPQTAAKPTDHEEKNSSSAEIFVDENKEKNDKRLPVVKPSIKDIANRVAQSEEIRNMFNEVQNLFGRTLGYDGQSCLLMLHDYYGLPTEVVVMLCAYAKTIGKQGSLSYIMKMGENCSDNEINTFELASAKIARLESTDKVWNELKQMTGIENPRPTSKQSEFLEIWTNDYNFGVDMINLAYEKAVEKKGNISFSYMNGILRSWHESGYKTTDDVINAEREYTREIVEKQQKKLNREQPQKIKKSQDTKLPPPSYDIELALKQSRMLDPTKTKRGQ